MAQTLSARIQLTGADEIRRALADLTAAGGRFFVELQQAAARTQFGLSTDQAKSDLLDLKKVGESTFSGLVDSAAQTHVALPVDETKAGFREIEGAAASTFANVRTSASATFREIGALAQDLGKTLSGLSGVFNSGAGKSLLVGGGILGALGGLFALTKSAATGLSDVNDKAKDLDITVNELQRRKFTLQSLGLSDGDVTKALGNFSKAAKAVDTFSEAQETANEKVIAFAKQQGLILPPKDSEAGKAALQGVAKTFSEIQVQGKPSIDATTAALANFGATADKTGDSFDRLLTRVVELNKETINRDRRGQGNLERADSNDVRKAQKDLLEKAFGEEIGGVLQRRLQRLKDQGLTAGEILQKFRDDFDKRKLTVSDDDIKRADEFRGAMDDLGTSVTQLGVASAKGSQEFGLLFAPAFTPAIEALAEGVSNFSIGLRSNRTERLAFIQDLGGRATQAIKDFFANLDPQKVLTGLKQVGENIIGLIQGVILPAFEALATAASKAAEAINSVLGTKFSGLDVGFIATMTLLLGRIDAVAIALALLFTSNTPAVERFKEQLKAIGIDIDAIKIKLLSIIQDFVAALGGAKEEELTNKWVKPFADFAKNIGPAIIALGALAATIDKIAGPGASAQLAVAGITGVLDVLVKGVQIAFFSLGSLSFALLSIQRIAAALGLLFGGLFRLTGVGLAITAVAELATHLDDVQKAIERVLTKFKFEGIGAGLLQLGKEAANGILFFILSIFEAIGNPILSLGEKIWENVKTSTARDWEAIKQIVSDDIDAIKKFFDFGKLWDNVKTNTARDWEQIKQIVSDDVDAIKAFFDFSGFWDGLVESFTGAIEKIKDGFVGLIDFIKDRLTFKPLIQAPEGAAPEQQQKGFIDTLKEVLGFKPVAAAPNAVAPAAEGAAQSIEQLGQAAAKTAQDLLPQNPPLGTGALLGGAAGALETAVERQFSQPGGPRLRDAGGQFLPRPPAPTAAETAGRIGGAALIGELAFDLVSALRDKLLSNTVLPKPIEGASGPGGQFPTLLNQPNVFKALFEQLGRITGLSDKSAVEIEQLGTAAAEAGKNLAGRNEEQQKSGLNEQQKSGPTAGAGAGPLALNPIALIDAFRKLLAVLNPISSAAAADAVSISDLEKQAKALASEVDADSFTEFAKGLATVRNETERTRLATIAFDDQTTGKALSNVLKGGAVDAKSLSSVLKALSEDLDKSDLGDISRSLKQVASDIKLKPSDDTTAPTLEKITTAAKTASAAIAQFGGARDQALAGETNKPLSQREFAQFQGIQPFGLKPGTTLGKGEVLESIGPFFGKNQRNDSTPAPFGPTAQQFAKSETAKALQEFSKANDRVIGQGIREQLGRKGGFKELLPGVEPLAPFKPDPAATKQAAEEFGTALDGLIGKITDTKAATPLQGTAFKPLPEQLTAASVGGLFPDLLSGFKSVSVEFDKLIGQPNAFGLADLRATIEQLAQKFQFPPVAGEQAAQKFTTKETSTGTGKIIQVVPIEAPGIGDAIKRMFAPAEPTVTQQEFGAGKIITLPPKKVETAVEAKPEPTVETKTVEVAKAVEVAKPETVEVTAPAKVEVITPQATPAETATPAGGGIFDAFKSFIKFFTIGPANGAEAPQGILGGGIQKRTQDAIEEQTPRFESTTKFDPLATSENIDDQRDRSVLLKLNDAIVAKIITFRDNLVQDIHQAEPDNAVGNAVHELASALEALFEFTDKSVEQTKAAIEANQGELQKQIGNADIGTSQPPPISTAARSRFDPRTGDIVSNPAFQDFRQGAPDTGDIGVLQRVLENLRGILSSTPQAGAALPVAAPLAAPLGAQAPVDQAQQPQITPVLNTEALIAQAATAAQEFGTAFNQALAQIDVSGVGTSITQALTTAMAAIDAAVQTVVAQIQAGAQSAVQALDAIIERAQAAAAAGAAASSSTAGGGGGGGSAPGFWTGGKLAGPGTPTSDSILIKASRDEWVINAASSGYYGDGLMALLNARRIPRDLLAAALRGARGMRGFSLGGAVNNAFADLRFESRSIPAFIPGMAAGGAVGAVGGSLHPVTIPISIDGRQIANVRAFADRDAVSDLRRAALRAELTRTGRLPG